MKNFIYLSLISISVNLFAQSNTEVFLLDITSTNGIMALENLKNISNNAGYDNQPSFYDNNTVLFSSTRNKQTDIKKYHINTDTVSWKTNTAYGSEYSPLKMPNKASVSAVRLDENGLQRLYEYNLATGKSEIILKELKVGYSVWYNQNILVTCVLVGDSMDLVVSNLKDNTNLTMHNNVGRSLHKIPNSDLISFISYENNASTIKSLNPITGAIKIIKTLPIPITDMCWFSENIIWIPDGKIIAQFNTSKDSMDILHHFKEDEINGISRISVSPDGKHLALVSEESPVIVIQKQVQAFNKRDLESVMSFYANNVIVKDFPNDTLYAGSSKLESDFKTLLMNDRKASIEILKRIHKGKVVIDEERIHINGKDHHRAVLYEVDNGKIISKTFIQHKEKLLEAEAIVAQQLEAFNAKDIDAFVNTFDSEVKAYDFPNRLYVQDQKELHTTFSDFFAQTPDLHCEITNRIILGNVVIDEEYLTVNGDNYNAIAIYEIENGKIVRMTTVR
ncbi:nuclear transport factor 2 family protein [Lacinutrix sp. MEBiC02595]